MKRVVSAILCVLLAVLLLAGCGGKKDADSQAESEQPEQTGEGAALSATEMVDIILADLGISMTDFGNLQMSGSGERVIITFSSNGNHYRYVINGNTGEILESGSMDPLDSDTLAGIAVAQAGVELGQCTTLTVEIINNRAIVTFTCDGQEYTYNLNPYTGKVLVPVDDGTGDSAQAPVAEKMARDDVLDIALDAVGPSLAEVTNIRIESMGDVCTVTFTLSSGDVSYQIDEITGEILSTP